MIKMKEVTRNWMQYMISRNFPPLVNESDFQREFARGVAHEPPKADAHDAVADAIISNPPVYGHFHCAEALRVPPATTGCEKRTKMAISSFVT